VCPARYAAFIAVPIQPGASDPLLGRRDEQNDPIRTFYYPLHKLFPGSDCVAGATVGQVFHEYHRNEKLRRLHIAGGVQVVPGFDVNAYPFVRDSLNGGDLVELQHRGASVLAVPKRHDTLVRTVEQTNSVSGKSEIVRFIVPPSNGNRFETSLDIPPDGDARHAPEYLNIRHRVITQNKRLIVRDMKELPHAEFEKLLQAGNYEAAHFTDDTCDGVVAVTVSGIFLGPKTLPAYSVVAAPDFFPLADQLEVTNWVRRNFQNYQEHFRQGAPWPLCEGRRAANIELPRPDILGDRAFDRNDETMTAIGGTKPRSRRTHAPDRKKLFASFMTDAASNEFEPGWDVSLTSDDQGFYLAAYGLGSPFPEDSKLCAALNSFWPAVAPDASRTFRIQSSPTAIPMLDGELGYHPDHPRVKARQAKSSPGWDGEYGPFFEKISSRYYVNAASFGRSDYVSNALADMIDVRKTSWIDANELIRRMEALRRCIAALPPEGDHVSSTKLWLVSAETVKDWSREPNRADAGLVGAGFIYVFALVEPAAKRPSDISRLRYEVKQRFECHITDQLLATRRNDGPWKLHRAQ
jgi:hypothetical protein